MNITKILYDTIDCTKEIIQFFNIGYTKICVSNGFLSCVQQGSKKELVVRFKGGTQFKCNENQWLNLSDLFQIRKVIYGHHDLTTFVTQYFNNGNTYLKNNMIQNQNITDKIRVEFLNGKKKKFKNVLKIRHLLKNINPPKCLQKHGDPHKLDNVCIVCMQKNETDIIELWVDYYLKFIPADNIYILDNLSNPETLRLLKQTQKKGINVIYGITDFSTKAKQCLSVINKIKEKKSHINLVLPLDMDEFLVAYKNNLPTFKTDDIVNILHTLPYSERYIYDGWYDSLMFKPNETIKTLETITPINQILTPSVDTKSFFRVSTLVDLDQGFHIGEVQSGISYALPVHLARIHYHHRDAQQNVDRMINICEGYGYITNHKIDANKIKELAQSGSKNGIHRLIELSSWLDNKNCFIKDPKTTNYLKIPTLHQIVHQNNLPAIVPNIK